MGRKKIYESREEYYKQYYNKNKEAYQKRSKKHQENNPGINSKYWENFKKNGDIEQHKLRVKEWNKDNKDRINYLNRERRKNNPSIRLQDSVSSTINRYLKEKTKKTNEYLGCTYEEYALYLEKQFDNKMNWGNYGKYWEIDHIHPLSKGGSFHYTNTRPLPIIENRSKGSKII
jgi:hypothetical protein